MTNPLTRFGIIGAAYHPLETRRAFRKFNILSRERSFHDPHRHRRRKSRPSLHKDSPTYSGDYGVPAKAARYRRVAIEIYLKINAPNIYGCIIRSRGNISARVFSQFKVFRTTNIWRSIYIRYIDARDQRTDE